MIVWCILYILFMPALVLALLWWINGARLRRMKPYRTRGSAMPAWAEALPPGGEEALNRFLLCLQTGFGVPEDLARCFAPADTVMAIYLTMYPEHCTYDDLELVHLLSAFKKTYGWSPKEAERESWASWPLIDLFKTVSH